LERGGWSAIVDEIDVLVIRTDVFELNPLRGEELPGVLDRECTLADEGDGNPRLLHHLSNGSVIGKFSRLDVTSRGQPHRELAVPVHQNALVADDKDGHGKVSGHAGAAIIVDEGPRLTRVALIRRRESIRSG
jgi:hypothetical protein